MLLKIHRPTDPLRRFIKSMIVYEGYTGSHRYEKLLPDGNIQLVIALDDEPRLLCSDCADKGKTLKKAWVTGVQTGPVTYRSEQNAATFVIQFEIGGLYALSGVPASAFESSMVASSAVFGNWLSTLREQLAEVPFARRAQLAERCLIDRLCKTEPNLDLEPQISSVKQAVKALHNHQHALSTISEAVGYSQKRLIEIFKLHVGLSPKRYARLLRFNRLLPLLTGDQSLIEIAQHLSYYDQSHMTNEFRDFAGLTPAAYRQLPRDYPHVLPTNTI